MITGTLSLDQFLFSSGVSFFLTNPLYKDAILGWQLLCTFHIYCDHFILPQKDLNNILNKHVKLVLKNCN